MLTSTSRARAHSPQAPAAVVLIRPSGFVPNPDTAADNAFQRSDTGRSAEQISRDAYVEVSVAADILRAQGVVVHLFEDTTIGSNPDAVFPNNWFSTHPGGHIAVYPMFSPSRRLERRSDVIETLKSEYRVQDVIDYSGLEHDGIYLEGTGAMVLDHLDHVAYVCTSNRADPVALERFATNFNFEPMAFEARDGAGVPIYHTNVFMCIGTDFAMAGFDLMMNARRRDEIERRLTESGRDLVRLSAEQVAEFAGNAMELQGSDGRIVAISRRALASLRPDQVETIEQSARIVPLDVPTIELAGGSVRCMLAGVHLSRR